MKTELETKTGLEISIPIEKGWDGVDEHFKILTDLQKKCWVSWESHEAALKEAEEKKCRGCKDTNYKAGKESAKAEFLALLAEQRKKIEKEKMLIGYPNSELLTGKLKEAYAADKAKLELLVLLEERTK